MTLQVGTAAAAPGELATGWLAATPLPTGGNERLPIVVANGVREGPTLWLTGGVHGDEATGVATVQDTVRAIGDSIAELRGTVVAVPVVSPAGLRRTARETYYGDDDPNREFPDPEREPVEPPEVQERIDRRLFEAFADPGAREDVDDDARADALVDCHTAAVGSVPFVIRDRVLYGERRSRESAETLADELEAVVDAVGFPAVTEYPAAEYVERELQRSLAGAALNAAGIPAVTVELGSHSVVEEAHRAAGVAGIVGVARELGLLASAPAGVDDPGSVPAAPVDYPVRRFVGPRTETAGLVRHRVAPGDPVEAGDAIATIVTPHGEELAAVESDHDGYVLGRAEGLAVYEGDPVARLAVRDDGPLVAPREAEGTDADGDGSEDDAPGETGSETADE